MTGLLAPAHTGFVTGDGVRLAVREDGDPAADLTLLLVHGWTQDHTSWDRVVDLLPPGRARVIRHDHRGHGTSDPAPHGTATIGRIADDLAELIADRAQTGPLVLAGHSMGGATIMALAAAHPEVVGRLAGVAFVATTSGGLSELTFGLPRVLARQVLRVEGAASRRAVGSRRPVLLRRTTVIGPVVRRTAFGRGADRAEVAATARQIGRAHPASVMGFLDSLLVHERSADLAALRDTRCVVLHGDRDRLLPPGHARVIARALPDADTAWFPGAGHMLMSERPREVAQAITRLLP